MIKDKYAAILKGLQEWREKEQKLGDYFSPAAMKSREALKLKLDSYRALNVQHSGGKSLLLGVLQAEIRHMEKQLHPNWLVRQMERVSYMAGRAVTALREWMKPQVIIEKPAMLKVVQVAKDQTQVAAKEQAVVKGLPQLNVKDVLSIADRQKEKRLLLKKEQKNNLLPKKNKQKSRSLSVH